MQPMSRRAFMRKTALVGAAMATVVGSQALAEAKPAKKKKADKPAKKKKEK